MDTDHDHKSSSSPTKQAPPSSGNNPPPSAGGGDESIESGWSWDYASHSSSRGGGSHANAFSVLNANKGPFKNSKRTMSMVYNAFGDEGMINTERIKSAVMNCTKQQRDNVEHDDESDDEDEDGFDKHQQQQQQQQPHGQVMKMAKIGLLALIAFFGIFQVGRFRGHRIGSEAELVVDDASLLSMSSMLASSSSKSSSLSMSEQYLRGNLPSESKMSSSSNAYSSSSSGTTITTREHNNTITIIHQAIFPIHLSHLSNLTKSYNPNVETPYFWDVHFSGESVAESIFSKCHSLVQAAEFGLRQFDYNEDVSFIFRVWLYCIILHSVLRYGTNIMIHSYVNVYINVSTCHKIPLHDLSRRNWKCSPWKEHST